MESSRPSEAEPASSRRALRSDPPARAGPVAGRAGHYGETAATFPISRVAVMRRPELLAEAELVTSRKRAGCAGTVSMLSRGSGRAGAGLARSWPAWRRDSSACCAGRNAGALLVSGGSAIDPAIIEDIESVWSTLVASRLKALVETGPAEGAVAAEPNFCERSASRERGPLGLGRTRERASAGTPVTNAGDHERRETCRWLTSTFRLA